MFAHLDIKGLPSDIFRREKWCVNADQSTTSFGPCFAKKKEEVCAVSPREGTAVERSQRRMEFLDRRLKSGDSSRITHFRSDLAIVCSISGR
jgi:hypothetical protein